MAKLTSEEKEHIKFYENMITSINEAIEAVKKFKEGDYLIAHYPKTSFENRRPVVNSYGAPKKFQVIAIDKHGVPYMKELSKKGKPVGLLISSIRYSSTNGMSANGYYDFEVDPDYADAIILDDQANYNASNILKEKSDAFRDIAKHNKNVKISCSDMKALAIFLSTVKVGDTLWRSYVSSWIVTEINPIPRDKANRLDKSTTFMKVTTNKGEELSLKIWDFDRIALYSQKPRSYRELKDPK